ncbi:hypothetical protein SUGI_0662220 [Cryptomeria japonica]|nr:hypothetical protein SUGI_0662220 [Cryptomeria japonica]
MREGIHVQKYALLVFEKETTPTCVRIWRATKAITLAKTKLTPAESPAICTICHQIVMSFSLKSLNMRGRIVATPYDICVRRNVHLKAATIHVLCPLKLFTQETIAMKDIAKASAL